ncbi:unnamed protein product [Agarophyton chilense]
MYTRMGNAIEQSLAEAILLSALDCIRAELQPALSETMVFLDQNAFMSELSKLYTQNKTKGSVWITMKRVERPINTGKHKLDLQPPSCLVRATDGKRKLACVVSSGDHLRFHMDLFTIIKANATDLQKPKRNRKNNNSSN